MQNQNTNITIKIGGEAGFGIKIAGATLGKVFSRMGYDISDYTEYPSLIRGGHNTFEITIGTNVFYHQRPIDLLVALNQKTVDSHISEMATGSGIIFDPAKVKVEAKDIHPYAVPLSEIIKQIGGSDLMKNTVALGAVLAVLGAELGGLLEIIRQAFTKKSEAVVASNLKAGQGGYDFIKKNFKEKFPKTVEKLPPKEQIYLTGNEAVGMGAIAAGCKLFAAYPMTPATSVLEFMAKQGTKTGIVVRQTEDEISALNVAIGAGFTGVRSMVCTSGGGFSLMVEALGLAGITETPVVIFEAQRPGPATGLPTWTEQGDLRFLLHAAQSEFPRMIIAPGDASECFYHTAQAFNFAEKYQMPVFVVSDKDLAESGRTISKFDTARVKIDRGQITDEAQLASGSFLRYKITESGVSSRSLPGAAGGEYDANSDEHDEYGLSSDDSLNRVNQMDKRMRKLAVALNEVPDPILYGLKNADLTIVSWGSTKGTILQALEELKDQSVNFLHFIYVWPFPTPNSKKMLTQAKKLMVIENNATGQLDSLIKEFVGRIPEIRCLKYDGRPFWPNEIVDEIKKVMS